MPPGCCVTAEAYRRVTERADLTEVIDRLAETSADDVAALSGLAARAREYGIPAVVGVPDATARIAGGQVITVDGASGAISISDEP